MVVVQRLETHESEKCPLVVQDEKCTCEDPPPSVKDLPPLLKTSLLCQRPSLLCLRWYHSWDKSLPIFPQHFCIVPVYTIKTKIENKTKCIKLLYLFCSLYSLSLFFLSLLLSHPPLPLPPLPLPPLLLPSPFSPSSLLSFTFLLPFQVIDMVKEEMVATKGKQKTGGPGKLSSVSKIASFPGLQSPNLAW